MPLSHPDLSSVRKILVIRYRSIGDIILTQPVLDGLRRRFPEARIDYLVDDLFVDVLHGNGSIDRIVTHSRRFEGTRWEKLLHELAFIRSIRAERYDLVVDLQGGPRGAWLALFSGAPVRVGLPFRLRNRICYNVYGDVPAEGTHTVMVQLGVVAPLGVPSPDEPRFHLETDPAWGRSVKERLEKAGLDFHRPLVVLHPGARIHEKRWPSEQMGQLARWLTTERHASVVVVGAPPDREEVAAIRKASGLPLPSSTELSVGEMIALIGYADLVVCNDSGPMHVAGALDVPTIALFGPSDPAIWGPVGHTKVILTPAPMECMPCDQKGCPHTGVHCMTKIPTDEVMRAVDRMGVLDTPVPE